jgi:hypothetical protein
VFQCVEQRVNLRLLPSALADLLVHYREVPGPAVKNAFIWCKRGTGRFSVRCGSFSKLIYTRT